jgi:alkylation response protein AidB-like acyl-CoA dehydrogenase
MAPADQVIKPEFQTAKKHFIFTEEHDALRESIGSFVEKELAPHAERWEEETFDDWVFERMGELGFLGLSYLRRKWRLIRPPGRPIIVFCATGV